jgi:hypothetical protein
MSNVTVSMKMSPKATGALYMKSIKQAEHIAELEKSVTTSTNVMISLQEDNLKLEKERDVYMTYFVDAKRWFDKHDPNGYVSPAQDKCKLNLETHNLEQRTDAIKGACEYAQVSLFETSEAIPDDYEGRHQKQGALAFKGRCLSFINRQVKSTKGEYK